MLSVLQHARTVLHGEQSLVVLCIKENFVYFAQRRFELGAWKKNHPKLSHWKDSGNKLPEEVVQMLSLEDC